MIEIFVDGACSNNGSENSYGAFAVVVYKDGELVETYVKGEKNTTNNICEMKAILYAIIKYGKACPTIYSDSAYAINSFENWRHNWKTNGWRKADGGEVKNLELVQAYDDLVINKGYRFCLKKVKGHSNCEGNIIADKLAVAEVTRMKDTDGKTLSLDNK